MPATNPKLKNVFLLGFTLALHLSLTAYVSSSFLADFVGGKVALVYTLSSLVSILGLVLLPKLFRAMGVHKLLCLLATLSALSLFLLSGTESAGMAVTFFILYFTWNILIVLCLDELLKIFSQTGHTGRIRGLYLTAVSSAWVISQLVIGQFLGKYSYSAIFLTAALLMLLFLFFSLATLRGIRDPRYDRDNVTKFLKKFEGNANLVRAYKINFLLQFFYSWMVIYTPIHLRNLGFDWGEIGVIFSIMLCAFILVQFPLGKYSDRVGERGLLLGGFLVVSIFTSALFFIGVHSLWLWALLLFAPRIGAATIEVMSDVYFFKHIRAENEEFIGVYRNAVPLSYIAGPLTAFLILMLVPGINFLFLILGAVMLYGVYLASTIRKGDI